jgi:hypothetical protein
MAEPADFFVSYTGAYRAWEGSPGSWSEGYAVVRRQPAPYLERRLDRQSDPPSATS